MTIYDDLKIVASEVMTEFKQGTVDLIKITPGAGPADNPGAATSVTHSLNAVVRGASFKYVTQGLAVASDLEITCSVSDDVTPSEKDFLEIDSVKYKIVQLIKTPAAGTQIVWKFIVRKGS